MAPEGGEPTLLCTGRAHNRKRYQTHIHTRPRVGFFFLSLSLSPSFSFPVFVVYIHTRVQRIYAPSIAKLRRNRRCSLARLRTCMRRMLVWCTGGARCTYTSACHLFRANALSVPPLAVCVHMRERAVCLYTRGDNAIPRRTQVTRRLGELHNLVPLAHRGTTLHLHTIRYERATRQAGSAQN